MLLYTSWLFYFSDCGDDSWQPLKKFEDIEAWQKSRELTNAVYKITKERAFSKDFGLKDQIRRAAVSVMSNIAEGFERSVPVSLRTSFQQRKVQPGKSGLNCTLPSMRAI